jgi:hypothetical protein
LIRMNTILTSKSFNHRRKIMPSIPDTLEGLIAAHTGLEVLVRLIFNIEPVTDVRAGGAIL